MTCSPYPSRRFEGLFNGVLSTRRIPECTLCGREEVVAQDELGQLLCEEHQEDGAVTMLDRPVINGFPVFGMSEESFNSARMY